MDYNVGFMVKVLMISEVGFRVQGLGFWVKGLGLNV
jgi:hypothetical protein